MAWGPLASQLRGGWVLRVRGAQNSEKNYFISEIHGIILFTKGFGFKNISLWS